uniref:AC5 n=1 Tax=Squash leaf curl China virus TaxID=223323 RepID=A0A223M0Q3_9GEMI|nr:AC5 [Squash leaf curl China virus]
MLKTSPKSWGDPVGRRSRTKKNMTLLVWFLVLMFSSIHNLPQHIDGFHTESLPYAMCESGSTCNITNTHDLANMRDIVPRFKRTAPYKGLHSPLARRNSYTFCTFWVFCSSACWSRPLLL